MKIEQNITVHNRFDVEVRDKNTGELKQTAVGYNVITNNYFYYMLLDNQYSAHTPLGQIVFGRGSGTPSVSDTALFSQIDYLATTTIETVYAYPTSHITKRITLDADSYNGETITEVGFRGHFYVTTGVYALMSHAMLQDSEGQQIAIHKTDTDVVYINATFFCTYTPSGFGNNGIYPTPSNNLLVKWIFGEGLKVYTDKVALRAWHHPLTNANDLSRYYTFNKEYNIYSYSSYTIGIGHGDYASKTLTIEGASMLSSEGGTQAIRTVGFPYIGAFVFPDASVMERYVIQNKTLGNGDGVKKDFNLGAPFIKSGTVRVFIDDVEQTPGVDFTVDYDSNGTDNYGNYHSAKMTLLYDRDHVVWGDEASKTRASSTYYDPICMTRSLGGGNLLPSSCSVTAAKPIWIDFSEAKNCNTMKIARLTIPAGKEDNMVIEHSDDNVNWTAVTYTRTNQVYKFADVSARYWRVYISGYTWSYSFNGSSTLDGCESITASFFLGETSPGLHFVNAPANGTVITASYDLDVPYKTENNIIRITVVISLNRD